MRRAILFLVTLFLLVSCSMRETKIYSVVMPQAQHVSGQNPEASIVILVHAPRHLDQPYIVYGSSPYQVQISRYSKWQAPPGEILRDALRDDLGSSGLFREIRVSNTIPDGFYSLRATLKRFERLDEGSRSSGELVFDVQLLSPEAKELYRRTISKKIDLPDRSFLSLAKGLSTALEEGVGEVRTGVVESTKRR